MENYCFHIYFIVMMENMSVEKEFIFKSVGVYNPLKVMENVREKTIRPIEKVKSRPYVEYWKEIPPDVIDKVRFVYRYEIMLFGYPQTPFVL